MDLIKRKEISDLLFQKERIKITPERTVEPAAPKCGTFDFPLGLAPIPVPINPKPKSSDPLPKADIVLITWTSNEQEALADIFTHPYVSPTFYNDARKEQYGWYPYDRYFNEKYKINIKQGAPSLGTKRHPKNQLGNYFLCKVAAKTILVFKSELHLNQDGIYLNPDGTVSDFQDSYLDITGYATLPVKDLFKQIAQETGAKLIITTGTCGASMLDHNMGDVVVTRGAAFLLSSEFEKENFNNKFKRKRNGDVILEQPLNVYQSTLNYSNKYFDTVEQMFNQHKDKIQYFPIQVPITQYKDAGGFEIPQSPPSKIHSDITDLSPFFPILTTDFFEYGTSSNGLDKIGCGCEMGDAVLGLACKELDNDAPKWLVIRNLSDPVMNGNMIDAIRDEWAVYFYEQNGYWTTVNSALTAWAVIADVQILSS